MKIGQKVKYDGFKLDPIPKGTRGRTIFRRKESGVITQLLKNDWVEVTLDSGIRLAMESTRMEMACDLADVKGGDDY